MTLANRTPRRVLTSLCLFVALALSAPAQENKDAILLNDISQSETGIDSERNAGVFLTADSALELPSMPKAEMAARILDQLHSLRARQLVR